jgi:hypothetical protein
LFYDKTCEKRFFFLFFCSFLVSKTDLATGAPLLDEEFFQSILQKYHLTEKDLKSSAAYKALPQHIKEKVTESSYCYRNLDGEVHGNHIHELRGHCFDNQVVFILIHTRHLRFSISVQYVFLCDPIHKNSRQWCQTKQAIPIYSGQWGPNV